jgi:hypothetical protein
MNTGMSDAKTNLRIAALNEEMDTLHYANSLYWRQGQYHNSDAKALYQFRQDRLDQIRSELAQLDGQP